MILESIILMGPGSELFPIVNKGLSKACLPVLNRPMVLHTMEFLEPVSKKFLVVGLEEERVQFMHAVEGRVNVPMEYVGIETFDGTVSSLLHVYPRITTEDVIVCKGDIVTNMDMVGMVSEYMSTGRVFMTVLGAAGSEPPLVGHCDGNMVLYSNNGEEEVPFQLLKSSGSLTLTKEFDVIQLYVLKTSLFRMFSPRYFSFKHGLFPDLVRELLATSPVGIYTPGKCYIHQVRNIERYLYVNMLLKRHMHDGQTCVPQMSESHARFIKGYVKKSNLKDLKSVVGNNTVTKDVLLLNTILGHDCSIGKDTKIISSLIMDCVCIGSGAHVEGCLIGSGARIAEGSRLVNCKVSPGYVLSEAVEADSQVFSL